MTWGSDNVYMVTVIASGGMLELEVTVTDVEEEGSVSLSQVQPQVEIEVDADRSDPDGNISGTTWQWSKSMDMSDWMDIDGETSAGYTPVVADVGYYLRATATYSDNRGEGKSASEVSENPVEAETTSNAAPDFGKENSNNDDTDETGTADAPFLRSVDENTGSDMNIGDPVDATDDDDDELLYALGGTDVASFSIDDRSGQIKTMGRAGS